MTDIKYVAFDVHLATISAAVLDLSGKLITQAVFQTDSSAIRDFLRGISGKVHLTFEEGTQAQWLFDLTHRLVAELIVCNPRENHSLKRGNKSDLKDALQLATLLRAGLLKSLYHSSPQTATLKHLAHNYEAITQDMTRTMNRLKAVYRSQAVRCAGRDVYYTRNRPEWLAKLMAEGLQQRARFLYWQLDHLRELRREASKALLQEGVIERSPQAVGLQATQASARAGADPGGADHCGNRLALSVSQQEAVVGLLWVWRNHAVKCRLPGERRQAGTQTQADADTSRCRRAG